MPFSFEESSWKCHSTLLFIDYWPNLRHLASPSCRGGEYSNVPAKDRGSVPKKEGEMDTGK